jgi:hypothetical protein
MGAWHGGNWHHAHFVHHRPFVHRHHRFFVHRHHRFFVGAPIFASAGGCWRWVSTAWGPRRIWVCD